MIPPLSPVVAWALAVPLLLGGFEVPGETAPQSHPLPIQVTGTVVDPETHDAVSEAWVFFETSSDSVRTDADGRFTLNRVPGRALRIEHPDYLSVRFPTLLPDQLGVGTPTDYMAGDTEILAAPLRYVAPSSHVAEILVFVIGPGSRITAASGARGNGTWCDADVVEPEERRERMGTIKIMHNDVGNYHPDGIRTDALFGDSARRGAILVTCLPVP